MGDDVLVGKCNSPCLNLEDNHYGGICCHDNILDPFQVSWVSSGLR
jgi:hypothetical protein